jgi:hypothetical protein
MKNKIKIEVAVGIILFVAVIIGGIIWLSARNEINLASQQKISTAKPFESLSINDGQNKVNNDSDLLEMLKIRGGVECVKDEIKIITDGRRTRIDYKTNITASSLREQRFNIIDNGIYTYRWMGKKGEKIKLNSSGDNSENFWENNFENLAKNQDLTCGPIKVSDVDFAPPSDVDFKFVDASGMNSF